MRTKYECVIIIINKTSCFVNYRYECKFTSKLSYTTIQDGKYAVDIIYFTRNKTRNVEPLENLILPCIDITIVLNGVMRYTYNQEEIVLKTGDVIVFKKGDVRDRKEGGSAEYCSFNAISNKYDDLPIFSGILREQVNEEVKTLIFLYEKYNTSFSRYANEKKESCFTLLYYTLYEASKISRENRYIIQIKKYIAEHIHEQITVAQVSESVFLSSNYCNSFFKSHTGYTLNEYIRKEKMIKAQHLIIGTNNPLKEIAASLGYSQYSYFTRVFEQEFHMSPAEYRKSITIY